MERTTFTFRSPSRWLTSLLAVALFSFVGIHQASAQLSLDVFEPGGNTPPSTLTYNTPEGDCGVNLQWVVVAFDTTDVTVTATITNPNLDVFPSASLTLNPNTPNNGTWSLFILAAVGTNTLTVTATSASGAVASQTFTIQVNDVRVPEIYAPDAITLEIPGCDTDDLVPLNYSYSVVDDCDIQPAITVTGPASGELVAAGNYTVSITAVDDFGNTSTQNINITVTAQPDDVPFLDVSGNGQFTIPACEPDAFVIFSGNIVDCNITVETTNQEIENRLSIAGVNLDLTYILVQDGAAYFEFTGNLTPGAYLAFVTYDNGVDAVTVDHLLEVVQDADQPADIIMPGNLAFLAPACAPGALVKFAVQIVDDCDTDLSGATFTLNGAAAPAIDAAESNPAAGLYVWELPNIPAGNYTLVANYTDDGGNLTTKQVTLVVTAQPDTWAPLIIYPAQDINVELDPCEEGPAIIFFEVTATDNCDGDIGATIFINPAAAGAAVIPSPGGPTIGIAANPGVYQVLIEAEDAAGNIRQEDFFITVTQDPRPVDNLGCNDNVIVTLDENCQAEIGADLILEGAFGCLNPDTDFDILVGDGNQANGNIADGVGTFPVQVMLNLGAGPISGFTGPFAPANWTISQGNGGSVAFSNNNQTLTLVSANGTFCSGGFNNSATIAIPFDGLLSFNWNFTTVDPFFDGLIALVDAAGTVTTLVNTEVNASGAVTNFPVTAGSVLVFNAFSDDCLLGSGTGVITNFSFVPQGNDDVNFSMCFGNITTVDKTAPDLECPDDTNEALIANDLQTIPGSLATTDAQFFPLNYSCFLEILNSTSFPQDDPYYYDLCTFTPTVTDTYTFFLDGVSALGTGPSMGAIFAGNFNPNNPCQNIIYQNDQVFGATTALLLLAPGAGFTNAPPGSFNPVARVTLPLEAGQTYTLLTTSTLPEATGDYIWNIFSDGAGVLQGNCVTPPQAGAVVTELLCDDVDLIQLPGIVQYQTNANGTPINVTPAIQALLDKIGLTGLPTVSDFCGNLNVVVSDQLTTIPGDCTDKEITRTFVVTDASGNQSTCQQVITFRRATTQDVIFPPFTTYIECDENFPVDANGNPDPSITGYPFVQTASGLIDLNTTYCNLAGDYVDLPRINTCDESYKLVRLWTVIDMCNPANSRQFQQIIQVNDYTGPEVVCPQGPKQTYSTSPFSCTASFMVPLPELSDNCSEVATLEASLITQIQTTVVDTIFNQFGQPIGTQLDTILVTQILPGQSRLVTGIPKGDHFFVYIAEDGCGNQTTVFCDFSVMDQIEPVAICDDDLNISIGGSGIGRVFAEDIDEGSNDNCGPVRLEVRRQVSPECELEFEAITGVPVVGGFTPWGPYVDVICCDVNTMVTIELRAWDDANMNGIFGGWYGDGPDPVDNFNICWLEVLVEDKVRPFCESPAPVTLDCDDIPFDFSVTDSAQLADLFGTAWAQDNCEAEAEELAPINNLDPTCNFGTIIRRFRAVDEFGNVSTNACQQVITINPITNYEIRFPRDAEENCGEPSPDSILINDLSCGTPFAIQIEDDTLKVPGTPECFKILRTYKVINWCEYDGISNPVIVSRDEDCDGNPGDEAVWVLVRPSGASPAGNRFWGGGGRFFPNTVGSYNWRSKSPLPSTITYFDRDNDETQWQTPTIIDDVPLANTKGLACDGLTNPAGYWINSLFDGDARRDPITGFMEPQPGVAPGQQGEADMNDKVRNIASVGYWQYTQLIKVYDDVAPIVEFEELDPFCSIDNVNCDGPVEYPFTVVENCTQDIPDPIVRLDAFADGVIDDGLFELFGGEVSGDFPDYTITGTFPIGKHAFKIFVSDGCGNEALRTIPFEVIDCKGPAPLCIYGLSAELMPLPPGTDADGDGDDDNGATAVWAVDYINSPIDDCSPPVTFSIKRVTDTLPPSPDSTGLILTCDDLGTVLVEIYAWDSIGNFDFCETFIIVQDNMNVCDTVPGQPATIAGVIETEVGDGVEGVQTQLSGNANMTVDTDVDGAYSFANVIQGYDYTITPTLDENYLNGVSTFDLVLISKHILGLEPLNSPYKLIAADVNNSQTVTTLDLLYLRQLILNVTTELPNNTSWRFVDASFNFPDPNNPWLTGFPEIININDLAGDMLDNDFVGVKVGDVNGSAAANANALAPRNAAGSFEFQVADQTLQAGDVYTVSFTAAELSRIQGYQFTLLFDHNVVELLDVEYGVATEEHFGLTRVAEGVITTSWNGEAAGEEVVFSLVVRAMNEVALSDVFGISSRYTAAEAYDQGGQLLDVALNFGNGTLVGAGFELMQNQPNPFQGETLIGFSLPAAGDVTLTIRDVTGKALKLIRGSFDKGYNQVRVNAAELPAGVLTYTMESGDFTATRKMIVVK